MRRVDGPDGTTTTTEAGPAVHLWWQLYTQERDRLRVVCRDAIRAGVAERQIRLAESMGELVGQLVRGVLDDIGLTGADRDRALEAARARFVVLAGGQAG